MHAAYQTWNHKYSSSKNPFCHILKTSGVMAIKLSIFFLLWYYLLTEDVIGGWAANKTSNIEI